MRLINHSLSRHVCTCLAEQLISINRTVTGHHIGHLAPLSCMQVTEHLFPYHILVTDFLATIPPQFTPSIQPWTAIVLVSLDSSRLFSWPSLYLAERLTAMTCGQRPRSTLGNPTKNSMQSLRHIHHHTTYTYIPVWHHHHHRLPLLAHRRTCIKLFLDILLLISSQVRELYPARVL